ncbi:MAG: ribonuclease P protein component [Candidatus Magasanikbacteria bacterium CG_4_10_14_0_8_um_filter_32_14]|uniref:Ribonuclease P protein component n=2 Tax=Candidatus Magasanikiibacteriota TaxID=1752731 RepID=A0A2M7R929_9BACT|nr:MAG: ribonuclease P protein component [Candidatus Magasanikbacteria bacterium CG1_02_32_51]PIY93268.1 MAG: ribonuclease P protein component [Candidatus Magasanikbacteria bacterium CG_4_10_14_0_8_um_filter_32_14]
MLSKENRLRGKKEWEILFNDGNFVGAKFLTMKVWKINIEKYPRRQFETTDLKIGFSVGLKISKSAVRRNTIRRKMREIIRLLLKENKIKTGFLIGFMAKNIILGVTYQEIEKDIMFCLKKMGLLI